MDDDAPTADDLAEKARHILHIMKHRETATTTDLTEETGYNNSLVYNHTRTLIGRGFLEKIGEKDVGAPLPANEYAVTDAGRRVDLPAAGVDDGPDAPAVDDARLDELERRLNTLERVNDNMWDALEERGERIDALDEKVGTILNHIKEGGR